MYLSSASYHYHADDAAEEAFDIACQFLSGRGDDETFTRTFVAREIIRLIDRGERHKIRLANLAIAAFEKQANAAHPWRV